MFTFHSLWLFFLCVSLCKWLQNSKLVFLSSYKKRKQRECRLLLFLCSLSCFAHFLVVLLLFCGVLCVIQQHHSGNESLALLCFHPWFLTCVLNAVWCLMLFFYHQFNVFVHSFTPSGTFLLTSEKKTTSRPTSGWCTSGAPDGNPASTTLWRKSGSFCTPATNPTT